VAATRPRPPDLAHASGRRAGTLLRRLAGLMGGVLAASGARAVDLPEDRGEALYHVYKGGGVTAQGPALLVRKSLADRFALGASLYVDSVSNASIDVVTTASPYHETRTEYGFSGDYVYRDATITGSITSSHEPDYTANTGSLDISQEVFGGMTTVSLGFTRGADKVGKHGAPEFSDEAHHWQYRLGATQILTPRWVMSANFEALADEGYLGSPYRVARVFGAAVPERNPRTRSARALKFRLLGDLGSRDAVHADYRYYRDTWDIKANTVEFGYSRYFGDRWLADAYLRGYSQSHALFYSDNAQAETVYISRNRQLSSFRDVAFGAKFAYSWRKVAERFDVKLNGAWEYQQFHFSDFTDIRTGSPYAYSANVLQLYLTATF
jgi:hypothetical protein